MESIKDIFTIGYGPSSSHTIGPRKAAETFRQKHPADHYRVTLYGSLAATGKGHLTDQAIIQALAPAAVDLIWKPDTLLAYHPNAVQFEAVTTNSGVQAAATAYSTGGGKIVWQRDLDSSGDKNSDSGTSSVNIYPDRSMTAILDRLHQSGQTFWEYVAEHESPDIWDHLQAVWKVMKAAVQRGIENEGVLPGGLNLARKAASYYVRANGFRGSLKRRSMLFAYALAVAEENAGGSEIVTAPTCGSCGVLPGILYAMHAHYDFSDTKIIRALATAGLVGNLVKTNASISGAQVGCQGEIGTACAMAAAAATQLFGGTPDQIEYAAEMGLEHHLGLTCDPIGGLVQIPCIERNAFAASRALDANTYAVLSDGRHRISFDLIVDTMNRTGNDLPRIYKETSEGGLATAGLQCRGNCG